MFQRIKGAIDSRIAEEQARAKASTSPVSRANSVTRRSTSSRNDLPSKKPAQAKPKDVDDGARGPDPSEFEAAFVVDDESEAATRAGTPSITDAKTGTAAAEDGSNNTPEKENGIGENALETQQGTVPSQELPVEVRTKLRKLERLESKYQELLRSYRVAHARAVSIEPFEKTLKENTPLTSIGDPGALIEYLNQLNLRGDMVMDELKRVTSDRDDNKRKFEQAEKEAVESRNKLAALQEHNGTVADISTANGSLTTEESQDETSSQPSTIDSSKPSVLSIFSPRQKPKDSKENKEQNEDFFSYDDEMSQMQSNLDSKSIEIVELKASIESVREELATAQKTNEGLVHDLEELNENLNEATTEHTKTLQQLKDSGAKRVNDLEDQIQTLNEKAIELEAEKKKAEDALVIASSQVNEMPTHSSTGDGEPGTTSTQPSQATSQSSSKKKNKKKKKGGASIQPDIAKAVSTDAEGSPSANVVLPTSEEMQKEIQQLKKDIMTKDEQILSLQSAKESDGDSQKEVAELNESIATLRKDHAEARDRITELQTEKLHLEDKLSTLENDLATKNGQLQAASSQEEDLKNLSREYEELKAKSTTLQTDLGAAQQLATSRYKDLSELREMLQKAQPELKALRAESATLQATKNELQSKTSELRRLENREKDLRSDVASFKRQASDRETEVRTLNEKLIQETNSKLRAEDQNRVAQRDLRRAEAEKVELSAASEKAVREFNKVKEDSAKMRTSIRQLEDTISAFTSDAQTVREELELKTSQYASAQGLVGSMRDQASEMATQLKETKEQAAGLEEELGEVQRLLGERGREAETMRRLLSDASGKAEGKVREMRERMEAALEERDRAEDEASTTGRRRARELDELRARLREAERELKRAGDEREALRAGAREHAAGREALERRAEEGAREVAEVREAMSQVRDALDASERQAREAERAKTELRRLLDEATARHDRLQRAQRGRAEELQAAGRPRPRQQRPNESPPARAAAAANGAPGAATGDAMDYMYLKTILLQFLEQKDKKHQAQLVPVIGMLLHFDKQDEQKWMSVLSNK